MRPSRLVLIVILTLAPLGAPLAADAQPAGKLPRVGYVSSSTRNVNVDAFEQGDA